MIRTTSEMQTEVRPNMRGGPGQVTVQHYLPKEAFGAKVRLCARLTIPAGAGIGMHEHAQEDEVYLVLSGEGLLDDGRSTTPIAAGDAVLTGKGGSHSVSNTGSQPLVIAAVIISY